MLYKQGKDLTYYKCEDWQIYAKDKEGRIFGISTEIWPEWLDFPNLDQELNAVEKYMLPIAINNWNNLTFTHYKED